MVSRLMGAILVLGLSTPALAAPDWRGAGGDIFVAAADGASAAGGPVLAPADGPAMAQPFAAAVDEAAAQHRIDPKLLHALVAVESGYRARAVSPAGAAGLTQLMPSTAAQLSVPDPFDVAANLAGGADYLARQIARFGDLRLALAAYNAGPARVARLGHVPDIAATRAYVSQVVDCYLALTAGRRVRSARDCRTVSP